MYEHGKGVPQDDKLAYVWKLLAATQGSKDAIKASDIAAKKLSSKELAEAQELASKIRYRIDHPAQ